MNNLKDYYLTCSPKRYDKMIKKVENARPKLTALLHYLKDIGEDYGYKEVDITTLYDPSEQRVILGVMSDVPRITSGWRTLYIADVPVKIIPDWLVKRFKIKPANAVLDLVRIPELLNDFVLLTRNEVPYLTYYRNLGTLKITTSLDLSAYPQFHTTLHTTLH